MAIFDCIYALFGLAYLALHDNKTFHGTFAACSALFYAFLLFYKNSAPLGLYRRL
jgi:hypothetical protein